MNHVLAYANHLMNFYPNSYQAPSNAILNVLHCFRQELLPTGLMCERNATLSKAGSIHLFYDDLFVKRLVSEYPVGEETSLAGIWKSTISYSRD